MASLGASLMFFMLYFLLLLCYLERYSLDPLLTLTEITHQNLHIWEIDIYQQKQKEKYGVEIEEGAFNVGVKRDWNSTISYLFQKGEVIIVEIFKYYAKNVIEIREEIYEY